MYTKIQFGHELKERVLKRQDVVEIGVWAYEVFLSCVGILDDHFSHMLITLTTMELGPEFALPYETLDKLADDLIAGRDVDL